MRSLVGGPACPAAAYVYERTYGAIVSSNGPVQRSSPGSRVQVLHLPLYEACNNGHVEAVTVLLSSGADPLLQDNVSCYTYYYGACFSVIINDSYVMCTLLYRVFNVCASTMAEHY